MLRTAHGDHDIIDVTVHPTLDAALLQLDDAPWAATALAFAHGLPSAGDDVVLVGRGFTEAGVRGELRLVTERVTVVDVASIVVDGKGASGSCNGDSGGPLLTRAGNGHLQVIGVLSRGSVSCTGLDEYVATSALEAWLAEVLGERC